MKKLFLLLMSLILMCGISANAYPVYFIFNGVNPANGSYLFTQVNSTNIFHTNNITITTTKTNVVSQTVNKTNAITQIIPIYQTNIINQTIINTITNIITLWQTNFITIISTNGSPTNSNASPIIPLILGNLPTNEVAIPDYSCIYNVKDTNLLNPTFYSCTNSIFQYNGYPPQFVNMSNFPQNANGQGYNQCFDTSSIGAQSYGINSIVLTNGQPANGLDVSFIITCQNFEIKLWDETDDYLDIYDEDDGTFTNIILSPNGVAQNYLIQYPNKATRHIRLYFECNQQLIANPGIIFNGIYIGQGDSISADTNLTTGMMVEGDSYCQGWNPTTGKYFYDSYATLAGFLTNGGSFHVMADGIGGSGFIANGTGTNYAARFMSDILPYTNLFKFFVIQASINDGGLTNDVAYFDAITNMIGLAKTYLPNKEIVVLGIPYNCASGTANNLDMNTNAMSAAKLMEVSYLDALDANSGKGIIPSGDVAYDGVHLSQAGYQILANYLNNQMGQIFSDYPNNTVTNIPIVNNSTNLNVLSFGALGDAVKFSVNTISNSTIIIPVGTNTFSTNDIGKIIEVFGAGPQLSYNGAVVVNQQDTIGIITNVQNNQLYCSLPLGVTLPNYETNIENIADDTTTNITYVTNIIYNPAAYCIVGSNNRIAFQLAIDNATLLVATGKYTNVNINISNGYYLLASSNILNPNYIMNSISDTHAELTISSGGITLNGQSTNVVLLSAGAGMEHLVNSDLSWIAKGYAPYVPMRDTTVICSFPIANYQYALVFNNITMDGGVPQGQQAYNYWTPIQSNGEGWDTTHHAVADYDPLVTYLGNSLKVFNHCTFQHYRGEMLICWTGDVPYANNEILNCTFYDGNATADNMYYGQVISNCYFANLGKVMEYYQGNAGQPTIFEDSIWTNIAPNNHYAVSIVGSLQTQISPNFTFINNQCHDEAGISAIQFSPACNVSVISNSFYGGGQGLVWTSAGVQPSNGSQSSVMTNFIIACNTFICGNPMGFDGYPVNWVSIHDNIGLGVAISAGFKDNFIIYNNINGGLIDCGPTVNQTGINQGHYPYDISNQWTILNEPIDAGDYSITNLISYANGTIHMLRASGSTFYLDDSHPNLMPTNGPIKMQVYAQTWDGKPCTNFYISSVNPSTNNQLTITGNTNTFLWINNSWTLFN